MWYRNARSNPDPRYVSVALGLIIAPLAGLVVGLGYVSIHTAAPVLILAGLFLPATLLGAYQIAHRRTGLANLQQETEKPPQSVDGSGGDATPASSNANPGPSRSAFVEDSFPSFIVTGHRFEVTPAFRNYVVSKIEEITAHFNEGKAIRVSVVARRVNQIQVMHEIEVGLEVGGRRFFAQGANIEVIAGFDEAIVDLKSEIDRYLDQQRIDSRT